MARRHADPVEVRGAGPGAPGSPGGGGPTHFLWHDRVYTVREVLGHWRESGPWWEAVRATPPIRQEPAAASGSTAASGPTASRSTALAALDTTEREVWRVEASRGRCYPPGVYDLSLDRAAGRWTLSRTTD